MPMYIVMLAHIVNRKAVLGAQVDSRRKRHKDFCEFGTRQAQLERSDLPLKIVLSFPGAMKGYGWRAHTE